MPRATGTEFFGIKNMDGIKKTILIRKIKIMKTTILLFALSVFSLSTMNAQIPTTNKKIPSGIIINPNKLDPNLNLETIKNHIASGKYCYTINLSLTAIIPPKNPTPLQAIDAYYSSTRYIKVERNYLRTNGLLVRSDKNFNRNFGNNFEVLIYPQRNDAKKVDENSVKLTWNIPESQLRTFNLKNVSVQYKSYGILIIGDYEVDGIVFGVSIGLIPTACLI